MVQLDPRMNILGWNLAGFAFALVHAVLYPAQVRAGNTPCIGWTHMHILCQFTDSN